MSDRWLDYSFARPDLGAVRAEGVVGVIRYLAPDDDANRGKVLFPPERDLILGHGLDLVLNWEWYSARALEGNPAGVADGQAARAQAEALGYPHGCAVFFSVDCDTQNMGAVDAYFDGVRSGLGGVYRVGVYGSFDVVRHVLGVGRADFGWQTVAWSNGQRDPGAVVYQDGVMLFGGGADEDAVTGLVGSWRQGGVVDLLADERQWLKDVHDSLGPLSRALWYINGDAQNAPLRQIIGDMSQAVHGIATSAAPEAPVDTSALAQQLLAALVPQLQATLGAEVARVVVTEIGAAITKGAPQ